MDRQTAIRIKSLETSIYALREINKSETLRSEIKKRNQGLIYSYTNEIYDELFDETERQGHPLGYMSIQYLGQEFVL
jgi:hypothetical protein